MFHFVLIDEKLQSVNIDLKIRNLLVSPQLVGLTDVLDKCIFGVFPTDIGSFTEGEVEGANDVERIWHIGINQLEDYYLVFDSSKKVDVNGNRLGVALKNQYNSLLKGSWDIIWLNPWQQYNFTVIMFVFGVLLIILSILYCWRQCFWLMKLRRYERKVENLLLNLKENSEDLITKYKSC